MRTLLTVSMLGCLLSACFREPTEAELLQSARKSLDESKAPAAVLQIKSALQLNSQSAEARFLLGRALLASFDPTGAQGELRRARALGQKDDDVVPELARALLMLGQEKKLLEEFESTALSSKAAVADLALSLATAYERLGVAEKSTTQLKKSLDSNPEYEPAVLFEVRKLANSAGAEAALARLASHKGLAEKSSEAAYLEGSLLLNGKGDVQGAIASFERALKIDPKALQPRASLVAIYLYKNDPASAKNQVALMKKEQPKAAITKTYEAQMALLDGDAKLARSLCQQVLLMAPKSVRALYIAGSAELQLRNGFQAVGHLRKALSLQPDLLDAKVLLANAYLQSGQAALAMKLVEPLLAQDKPRSEVISLAAQAQLQMGEPARAEALYKRALSLSPKDPQTRTALAMSVIANGQESEGLRQLASVAEQDSGVVADMALIASHMAKKRFDEALQRADVVSGKLPDKPLGPNTRGRILMQTGDPAGARAAFEQAIKRDPNFIPALNSLAILDLRQGQQAQARARFEALLKADPANSAALMSLADVLAVQNGPQEEVVSLLDRAVKADPADPSAHLMLVEYLLGRKDVRAAAVAGQRAVSLISTSGELFNALGRAQMAMGDTAQAASNFAKQAQLQPTSVAPYLSSAEAYRRAGDFGAAKRSLRQALTVNPNHLTVLDALFKMELLEGHHAAALDIARDLQKSRPTMAEGYIWEAAAEQSRQKWDPALAALKRGLERVQANALAASNMAGQVHQTLLMAKRDAEATKYATEWTQKHAEDASFRMYLGDVALTKADWKDAEQWYRSALNLHPDSALAANNLASVLARQKLPGAVEMAERALKLAPDSPDALDTLAMAFVSAGRLDSAIDAQRKALGIAPGATALRLKLAKYLISAGKKQDAEAELKQLEALGGRLPQQAEVAALLKSL